MILSEKNKHPFDNRIKFREEGHKYWVDNIDKDIISSTTFIHNFFEHFDENICIQKILNSSKHNDPDYEYYNMTKEQIKQTWQKSRDLGTEMHKDIEDFKNMLAENPEEDIFEFMFKLDLSINIFPIIECDYHVEPDGFTGCAIFVITTKRK